MNSIEKRLAGIQHLASLGVDEENSTAYSMRHFDAILCQLKALSDDLENYHMIEKCRCCDG